jgi:hypothetical protein
MKRRNENMRSIAQALIIEALAVVRPITIMKFLRDSNFIWQRDSIKQWEAEVV